MNTYNENGLARKKRLMKCHSRLKHKHTHIQWCSMRKNAFQSYTLRSLPTSFEEFILLCHLATGNRHRMNVNLLNVKHLNELMMLPYAYGLKRVSKIIRRADFFNGSHFCIFRLSSFCWLNSAKTPIYQIKLKWFCTCNEHNFSAQSVHQRCRWLSHYY